MKEVPLTRGAVALVDDDDYAAVNAWRWYLTKNGYAARRAAANPGRIGRPRKGESRMPGKPRILLMHRALLGEVVGHIHHVNGNKLDNQRANLEAKEPVAHWRGHTAVGAVSRTREDNWQARASYRGKRYSLGTHPSEAQARAVAEAFQRGAAVAESYSKVA